MGLVGLGEVASSTPLTTTTATSADTVASVKLSYTGWPLKVVGPRSSAETLATGASDGPLSVTDVPVSWHDVDPGLEDSASVFTDDSHETAVDDGLGTWGLPKVLEVPDEADSVLDLEDEADMARVEVDTAVVSLDIPQQTHKPTTPARSLTPAQQLQLDAVTAVYASLLVRRHASSASKLAERLRARKAASSLESQTLPLEPKTASWSASAFIGGLWTW